MILNAVIMWPEPCEVQDYIMFITHIYLWCTIQATCMLSYLILHVIFGYWPSIYCQCSYHFSHTTWKTKLIPGSNISAKQQYITIYMANFIEWLQLYTWHLSALIKMNICYSSRCKDMWQSCTWWSFSPSGSYTAHLPWPRGEVKEQTMAREGREA